MSNNAPKAQKNNALNKAKKSKKDEFYTQFTDIERELAHYTEHFLGKTVLCNCDDPRVSEFFRYFAINFRYLGLKRIITTCYKNNNPDLFSPHTAEQAVYLIYDGCEDVVPDWSKIEVKPLRGDGDFRSKECIELLKQADIVVTNPPFSLFREYVAQLVAYDKKFLIIGNQNAITHKEIFPLIKDNKIWLGVTMDGRNHYFGVPDWYPLTESTGKVEQGKKYAFVKSCVWFTNLEHRKRHEELILYKHYNLEEYPKYDNFDAINVDKAKDIPCDYDGIIGVPITFLHKYCPEQFEIIGVFNHGTDGDWDYSTTTVNGVEKYKRLAIQKIK